MELLFLKLPCLLVLMFSLFSQAIHQVRSNRYSKFHVGNLFAKTVVSPIAVYTSIRQHMDKQSCDLVLDTRDENSFLGEPTRLAA